ncbi:NAD(P)-binding protein [Aureobasidium sp. EXF-12298]|nr:NAD(P)-binding protein [Aureobasidium sp. EXF-12298]KAI4763490.1 NAD(P)-binding protein [Aureobasidium sp. EXF-12344]KAI4780572.1 NAD(P)-binding protein [Aureobasidium sp. EXF-3400]
MSSPIKKVAIVGATGNMGKHTIAELQKSNKHSITALTRKGSSISLSSSINVLEVDYDSIENLTSALDGQDLLMITLAVDTPPHIHPNLVSAAAAAGVKYVIPNAYGFDFTNPAINADIPVGHLAQEYFSTIESHGMIHFSLVCGFWYEWSLGIPWCYGIDLLHRKAIFYDDGNTKMNTSTWEQCGRAIAALVSMSEQELDKYKNRSLYVSSFRVTQREMLDSVHRVLGTEDQDWEISFEDTKQRYQKAIKDMQDGDRTGFGRAMYARVFYPDGSGDYESSKGLDNEGLHLPQEDLDEATKRTVEMVNSGWNPFG